jgi:hypothetical protein
MIKNVLAILTASLFCALSMHDAGAQNAESTWVFGAHARMSFSTIPPTASVAAPMNSSEGAAAMSGYTGALMFYTDGVTVWSGSNTQLPNGFGLLGNTSSTVSALIVPCLCRNFFIFTTDTAPSYANGLRYSKVSVSLVGGPMFVNSPKNVVVLPHASEKIAAVRDPSGGFWVVAHEMGNNKFYAYRINNTTCTMSPPVVSNAGAIYSGGSAGYGQGQMKFSPNGQRLAVAGMDYGSGSFVELFNFNLVTGHVTQAIGIPSGLPAHNVSTHGFYGVEFAPNSNVLYATTIVGSNVLYRFDVTLNNLNPTVINNYGGGNYIVGGLQRGPDGKIYIARTGMPYLGVLHAPNAVNGGWTPAVFNLASGSQSGLGMPAVVAALNTCM